MKKIFQSFILALLLGTFISLSAQVTDPLITSWKLNTTGAWVYDTNNNDTILVDVESVHYDNSNVYVKASGVPSYYNFTNNNGNHNAAKNAHYVWKITRTPQAAAIPMSNLNGGQCGVIIDGSTFFNPEDARSYQNANNWHQLAYYFEGNDFDFSYGHSSPQNEYHHHVIDIAYVDTSIHNQHSPLIGYAFDGYPVYGPYGYTDPNDTTSAIIRMKPSWQKRNITQRTTYADGTVLQASQYGPAVGGQYPLGCYREDYEYVALSGTLDTHNGRFCKTPGYPNGIYAYFATIDSLNHPVYPEYIGQTFYGTVAPGNMGPTGGQNTIPGNSTLYVPQVINGIAETNAIDWMMFPNPTANALTIKTNSTGNYKFEITDMTGNQILNQIITQQVEQVDVSYLNTGTYLVTITDNISGKKSVNRCVKL